MLGISLLSGAHLTLVPLIIERLRAADASDIAVVVGGVIPDEDVATLKTMGVRDVLLQDTPPDVIVRRIREIVGERSPA